MDTGLVRGTWYLGPNMAFSSAFTPRLAKRSMAALLANKGLTREVRFKGARFRGADRTGKCRPVHRIRGRLRSNFRVGRQFVQNRRIPLRTLIKADI